ncbi:MAG: phosphotransferase [Oscillospiraceae bacterium]|nr:phosphotransferase [Oscillospiraceae bacterium]
MKLTPTTIDILQYPTEFHALLRGAKIFDSSCSTEAKVIFIDKDCGYFLKSAPKGTLERESALTRYFHDIGLSANVIEYISDDSDWLLTEKIHGDDGTAAKYLESPKRLCDTLAEQLALLHRTDFTDCPVQNHTERYLEKAKFNKNANVNDMSFYTTDFGESSPDEVWSIAKNHGHSLATNTLLHGDYCLPNIILNDWKFSGFIDLDSGGVGDRHVDVFWGAWTLFFNLGTNKYRERFLDAYGRSQIDDSLLRIVAAVTVFG